MNRKPEPPGPWTCREKEMEELTERIEHYEKTLETGINQNNGKPVEKKHVLALTAALMLLKKQKRDATQ